MTDSERYAAERARLKPISFDAARAILKKNGLDLVQMGELRVVVDG